MENSARVLALRSGKVARIRVLTIHFAFENMATERICNTADVKNLKELFSSYQNCIFEERASPTRAQILHFLSSEGTTELFPFDKEPPDIYIVIVLSHGSMNGVIVTDRNEQFTTEEVTRALGSNGHLQDALKIVFFAPCKGENTEKNVTASNLGATDVSQLSMKILAEPNQRNFAIFYSTMETMAANTDPEGSWMVKALCKTLKGLDQNVNVLELFRLIKVQIELQSTLNDRQMPQSYVYPHDRTVTFCKWDTGIRKDATGNISGVAPAGRNAFFRWKNNAGLLYNRGLALVFGTNNAKLCTALKGLDYQTECKDLKDIVVTLDNISSNGVVERVGSLFVVVFGKLVANQSDPKTTNDQPEWAIDLGNALVPIGTLTRKVVGTECPTLASKPKIFIFVNSDVRTDLSTHQVRVLSTKDVPSCLNHQHFLVMACHGIDAMDNLIRGLSWLHVDKKSILQDVLLETMHSTTERQNVDLIWSTMTYLVDFPAVLDKYSAHRLVQRDARLPESRYNFEEFVKRQAEIDLQGASRVVRVFGLGQTRFAEELYSRLVVKFDADVALVKLDMDPTVFDSPENHILQKFAANSLEPATKKVVVITDGWSNLNTHQRINVSECLRRLALRTVMHLIVTMESGCDCLLEDWRSETFELDVTECDIEIQRSLRSRREIKMKRLQDEARSAQAHGDFSNEFFFPQSISVKGESGKLAGADMCAEMITKSSAGSRFVLSCPPGMGKTINLRHIAIAFQRKLGDFRVIRLNLRDCFGALADFEDNMNSSEDMLCFMQSATKSRLENDKLASGRVIVLLDSVDEVCPRHREVTLRLLKLLKTLKIKVLVATRPQEEKVVADALEVCTTLKLDLISACDQPKFIAGVGKDPGKADEAKKFFEHVKQAWWRQDFWGIPLNLIMLAEVCQDEKVNVGETLRANTLCGHMIKKCIKDTVKFYNKNDQNRTRSQDEKDFIAGFNRVQELAVHYILGSRRIEASDEDLRRNINRYAFFVFIEGTNELRFTHQTYAEYLVAEQFVRKMNDDNKEKCYMEDEQLQKIGESVDVLRFVDSILTTSMFKSRLAKQIFSERFCCTCIESEFLNIFKLLHENEAFDSSFFNCGDEMGNFPLEILVTKDERCKSDEFAEYLVENGASLETFVSKENRKYMLKNAITSHCNSLVKNNWKIFQPRDDELLSSALHTALWSKNEELAKFFMEKGAKRDCALRWAFDGDCSTEMVDYIAQRTTVTAEDFVNATKHVEYLRVLLPKVASIDAAADIFHLKGLTALMDAARKNHHAAVEFLLLNGADPNLEDRDGTTSLAHAVERGAVECFNLLFDRTTNKHLNSLLLDAAQDGRIEIFRRVLENGADPNAVDAQGNTCLHRAARSENCTECLEFLLEDHFDAVDIEARNKSGQTPLLLTMRKREYHKKGVVALFLAKDADPSVRDVDGYTPLHCAARDRRMDECELLLGKIANVADAIDSQTNEGETPLMLAASRHRGDAEVSNLLVAIGAAIETRGSGTDVIKLLIDGGADADLKDEQGWNCLHHAAREGNYDNVVLLLPHVTDLECKTNDGETAEELAERRGLEGVSSLLAERAAARKRRRFSSPCLRDWLSVTDTPTWVSTPCLSEL